MEVSGQLHSPAAVFPGENAVTSCMGSVMGPRRVWTFFLGEQNILPVPKFEPRTAHLVPTALPQLLENKFVLKATWQQ